MEDIETFRMNLLDLSVSSMILDNLFVEMREFSLEQPLLLLIKL